MTREDIKALVLSVDPEAKHFIASKKGDAFTVWGEYERSGMVADDRQDYGWKFEIDRYTTDDEDEIAKQIEQALIDHPGVIVNSYRIGYDPKAGYIRHVFDCEGI